VGEQFSALSDDKLSESLAAEWNTLLDEDSAYALKYRLANKQAEKFVLKAVLADQDLVVSVIRLSDELVATMTLRVAEWLLDNPEGEARDVRDAENLARKVDEELMAPFFPEETKKQEESQQQQQP